MKRVLGWVAFVLGCGSAAAAHAAVTHVFMVQNSGWMEPFYVDAASQFKPLVKAVIQTMPRPQAPLVVAAFNQSAGSQRSPTLLYQGNEAALAAGVVDAIVPARKPGSAAYADTDFREALTNIATEHLHGSPAIMWIFTNNKNSPGNDADTAARNREFYELLHVEPAVVRTMAFPLAMPVMGKHYSAKGLMVYALAYGEEAGAALQEMLEAGVHKRVFTDSPVRLKPLDRDAVAFVPNAVPAESRVKAQLAEDGRSLVLHVEAEARPTSVDIQGAFRNEFFPYAIKRASLSAQLVSGDWSGDLEVSPTTLDQPLAPGEALDVSVRLPIPSAQIPSLWSLQSLAKMGTSYLIPAELRVSLVDQELEVAQSFVERVGEVFPGDPMPEVFKPSASVRASTALIPVQIRVSYPLYPLLTVAALVAIALGLLAFTLLLAGKERRFEVVLNGQLRKVAVKAFRSVELNAIDGSHVATLKRGMGKPVVAWAAPGANVHIKA